ncbi:hypothetical protein N7530_012805 [Penicillium desertorum]|uniref:Uncharacterized protein n=1 Tax=Penicillium desertorum TaxID=1303715 RepID=A0A9X0BFI7_9EURO|nr:hypothetical protein N7530_012805 [Penicillium desertorum]
MPAPTPRRAPDHLASAVPTPHAGGFLYYGPHQSPRSLPPREGGPLRPPFPPQPFGELANP